MSNPQPSIHPYAGVPGRARVIVTVVPADAPDPVIILHDGAVRPLHPVPLADVVKVLGGFEGEITDPFAGQPLHVSLQQWSGADLQKTRVVLMWGFHPKHPIDPKHRHLFDDFTLTHDTFSTITDDALVKVFDGTAPFGLYT